MIKDPDPNIYSFDIHTSVPIGYEWDQWDPYQSIGDSDLRVQALLRSVSDRAKLAFAIGCAEWVVGRLDSRLDGDGRPWQFLEALWVFEMSTDFALPGESDESEWQGSVRGAVDLALMTLLNVVFGWEDDNAEVDAAFAAALAAHVQFDKAAFRRWRSVVLKRLRKHYRLDPANRLGRPIPREFLAMNFEVDSGRELILIKNFLVTAQNGANPFLLEATPTDS